MEVRTSISTILLPIKNQTSSPQPEKFGLHISRTPSRRAKSGQMTDNVSLRDDRYLMVITSSYNHQLALTDTLGSRTEI